MARGDPGSASLFGTDRAGSVPKAYGAPAEAAETTGVARGDAEVPH
ncbi:hypothetical protein [Streptomyces sp. NPDC001068]